MKKLAALVLAVAMLLSVASFASAEEPRHILIGTTWDLYWDSTHESIEANPYYSGTVADEMMFAKVAEIEEEWGVTFEYVNLLYAGAQESINTSILAGTPDVDVYMIGLAIGAPAVANGYAVDLRDVLPADHPVLTGEDEVLTYIDVGDGSVSLLTNKNKENMVGSTYPLSFNLQMIEEANLEDPRDLVEKGEWTWEKFLEYVKVLTKDTDGDGVTDVYGFGGWPADYLPLLVMSNGSYIAAGETENLSSPEVAETLQFMQDLYLNGYAYPIPAENGWDICRFLYREGKVAFSPNAAWIMDSNKDYAFQNPDLPTLEFDMVFVPWPEGPSGDMETNAQKVTDSSCYMIPVGVEDPELVFNVLYDLLNWFNNDLSIRDDEEALGWWYGVTAKDIDLQDWNFNVMYEMGQKQMLEMVNNLGFEMDLVGLCNGTYTVAQFQETYKQQVQDALDRLMGN
ncbi:MAG: extracellular solute-binding protein [Clostridia bacterium]|nr:extracellular solute-binding protein [Clostridia bacterium]